MQGVWCRVEGVGCRVEGVGCRVEGVGCRAASMRSAAAFVGFLSSVRACFLSYKRSRAFFSLRGVSFRGITSLFVCDLYVEGLFRL